jgi:hypothetical protein
MQTAEKPNSFFMMLSLLSMKPQRQVMTISR